MTLPQGFKLPRGFNGQRKKSICRLIKFLYGLKQAPRQWNVKMIKVLVRSGFVQSYLDYYLLTKNIGNALVIILVYVDDMMITCNDINLGDLRYFLGIEFSRSKNGIVMPQRNYTLEIISEVGAAKPATTPLDPYV